MYRTADQSTVNIYESKCCSCSKSCRIGNSDHMDVRPVVYVVLKKINFFFSENVNVDQRKRYATSSHSIWLHIT